jgi:hypothetical protein
LAKINISAQSERPKNALEGFFIETAGHRASAWMGMHPDPAKLLGLQVMIDVLVKKVCYGFIDEGCGELGAILLDELDIFHQQQVILVGDAEAAHFGSAAVAQVQQLGPGGGRETQTRPGQSVASGL